METIRRTFHCFSKSEDRLVKSMRNGACVGGILFMFVLSSEVGLGAALATAILAFTTIFSVSLVEG